MTRALHCKFSLREVLLRVLLTATIGGLVLLASFVSRSRGGDVCKGNGRLRVRVFRDSDSRDLEYWRTTISMPLPLEQVLRIPRESKFLDLQPFHAHSYPSGKVSDVHLAALANSSRLEELRLGETCITDDGIRYLTALRSLRVLRLSRTSVSDRATAYLGSLTKLEMLDLDHTRVTDKGVARLTTLDTLRVLQLGSTTITDKALVHVSKLARLEDLYLTSDRVGDDGMRHLAGLAKLEYLDLRATRVTDEGLQVLQSFPALEIVRLDQCAISDAGILNLAKIETLELVDLFGAKHVTTAGVAQLKKLRPDLTICWQEKAKSH